MIDENAHEQAGQDPAQDLAQDASQAGYRVRLDAFEGPMDLLLHLIRKAEVDIHDIPIAMIAGQYIACLEGLERIDIEQAGEFLVVAATLMEIKSRMIQPVEEREERDTSDDEGEDPRAELVRQLLEYKKYRDASDRLEERRQMWEKRYPVARAATDRESMTDAIAAMNESVELDDVSITELVAAFERIVESVNFDRTGEHEVLDDDTPIELHAEDILDRIARDGHAIEGGQKRLTLQEVFVGRTRAAMLGLFLAVLELLKQQRATAKQDNDLGSIVLELKPKSDDAAAED